MEKIDVIREVPFFKPLRDEDLQALAQICNPEGHQAGTTLFRQGDPSDSFFIIVAGEVEIRITPPGGAPPKVFALKDGGFFGEMGVIRNAPRSGDAFLRADTVLLRINKHDFDRLMAVNNFFSSLVMESFLERSRQLLTSRSPVPAPAAVAPPPTILPGDVRKRGRVITVFSPSGGSGTTFLATNIASKILDFTKAKVLLVDLDLQFGTVELHIGVKPTKNLADVCQGIQIRSHDVLNYVVRQKDRPHVLPRPRNPEEAELFTPDKVRDILEGAAREYDYVVIDTHSMMAEPNMTALDLSQEIFMVVVPEVPAMSRMVAWLRLMNKLGFPDKRIRIILNKLQTESDISTKDIEARLGKKLLGVVPYDLKSTLASLNVGRLVVEGNPLCEVSVEIANVAREVLFCQQEDDDAESRGEKPQSFFGRLFGA